MGNLEDFLGVKYLCSEFFHSAEVIFLHCKSYGKRCAQKFPQTINSRIHGQFYCLSIKMKVMFRLFHIQNGYSTECLHGWILDICYADCIPTQIIVTVIILRYWFLIRLNTCFGWNAMTNHWWFDNDAGFLVLEIFLSGSVATWRRVKLRWYNLHITCRLCALWKCRLDFSL